MGRNNKDFKSYTTTQQNVSGAMNVAHNKPYEVKDATKGNWSDTATATDYANDTYKASKW
jgi:hypothetical protein